MPPGFRERGRRRNDPATVRANERPLALRPLRFPVPLVIAHRGGRRNDLPENSIAAFEHAIRCGADMIEFDVRRTRDGVIVVHHDAHAGSHLVSQLDHAQFRALAPQAPTLREVVQRFGGRVLFDVELKEAGYEREVATIVRAVVGDTGLVVTSFLDEALSGWREAWPEVRRGLIIGSHRLSNLMPYARMRECGADFLVPAHLLLRLGLRRGALQRGVPLMVWTVNEPRALRRLARTPGIAGIVTDDPARAIQVGAPQRSRGRRGARRGGSELN